MPKDAQQDLMTLAVEDGVEHVLDLSTGQQWRAMPAALRAMRRLAQKSVSMDRVERIVQAAGIRCGRDDEGDIWAELFGDRVFVLVSEDRHFVRFLRVEPLRPFVPEDQVNAVLNHLNNEFDVAKFRSYREDLVSAEYAMSYHHGLSPQQLVEMLIGFAHTVQQAYRSEPIAELLAR